MFIEKTKFVVSWMICLVLGLAASTSIIVGATKPLENDVFVPKALTNVAYFFGAYTDAWDWYPNSGTISDNLLSPIGIVSLIAFAIGVAGGWFSRRRLAELNEISRSLRRAQLQNKYRGQ